MSAFVTTANLPINLECSEELTATQTVPFTPWMDGASPVLPSGRAPLEDAIVPGVVPPVGPSIMPTEDDFVLNRVEIGITYPRAHSTLDELREFVFGRVGRQNVEFLGIGHERHQDGEPHFHVHLKLKKKVQFRHAVRAWTCGRDVPHFERVIRSSSDWWNYCVGENGKDVIAKFVFPIGFEGPRGKRPSTDTVSNAVAKRLADGDSLRSIAVTYPGFLMMNLSRIQAYSVWIRSMPTRSVPALISILEYMVPLEHHVLGGLVQGPHLRIWQDLLGCLGVLKLFRLEKMFPVGFVPPRGQLYLWGPRGVGKSTLVMKLRNLFRTFLMTLHPVNGLSPEGYVEGESDLCVIDEFVGGQAKLQWMNKWLDPFPSVWHVLGSRVEKTEPIATMILSNLSPEQAYPNVSLNNDPVFLAFRDRLKVHEVSQEIVRALSGLVDHVSMALSGGLQNL